MDEHEWLTEQFEANRSRLRAVAYRMLGSLNDVDDAVQEVWLRLTRADMRSVENLGGWLTTVTARVCLDMLRTRTARREEPLDEAAAQPNSRHVDWRDLGEEALLAEAVGVALLVVLDTLAPAERLAFVLHDIFAVPFDTIAPIVGRTPTAARQLASRARRRVRGVPPVATDDHTRQRKVVDAFLTAARGGDFAALLTVLDPDVVFRADGAAVQLGGSSEVRGAAAVAKQFAGRARFAQLALVNGAVGVIVAPRGRLLLVLMPTISGGNIVALEAVADPVALRQLDLAVLND